MSLYWDDFERRIRETLEAINLGIAPPIRRVAVFITNKCNFRCKYCKVKFGNQEMSKEAFNQVVNKYRDTALIHITGGEPSVVNWLYDYIDHQEARFHLNTNGFIQPPKNIKRLKVSLDSCNSHYIDGLVGVKGAFKNIVNNIKLASKYTTTSITCVITKENFRSIPTFVDFCNREFPKLYAIFFSAYKGVNPKFVLNKQEADELFDVIFPQAKLNTESLWLLKETWDEKRRILQVERFPENNIQSKCYLSLSEKVIDYNGKEYRCSHLFRDGILSDDCLKTKECKYGCNRKLIKFNQEVEHALLTTRGKE